ncbi:MAG: T9SS type A sorting domain-containing protein [Saprospiraceae bacterium]|nr:T9SS type A sorting domain-containing protein [Saprospiraceae bacterium]
MTHKLLLALLLLFAAAAALAQPHKIWNGSVSTDWSTAANWTPAAVPVAGDSVWILVLPGKFNPTIFSGTMAKAKNLYVGYQDQLTINAGAELELTSTLNVTALSISDQGVVTNHGTLKAKSGFQGIDVDGSLINNGTLVVGQPGSSPYSTGEEGIRVLAGGQLTNNSTGTITIYRPANNGILLNAAGANMTNHGTITIRETGLNPNPAVAATGDGIDARGGAFVNETTGEVYITRTSANGLNCRNSSGSMTNKGQITIHNVGLTEENELKEGIWVDLATFTNTATGMIWIDTTGNNGIANQGVFNNSGYISVGATTIGNSGLVNLAAFNNQNGGVLEISHTNKDGIFTGGFGGLVTNSSGGSITINHIEEDAIGIFGFGGVNNFGTLQIGNTGSIGGRGINNATTFINQGTGNLTILNTGGSAIFNDQNSVTDFITPTFTNGGLLTIGDAGSESSTIPGIENTEPAKFLNGGCGVLTTHQSIISADSFVNEAFLFMRSTLPNTISGVFINEGVIHDPNEGFNGQPLTNTDFIISPAAGECVISDVLQKGTGANVTIAGTWYKDQALTMTAGTYNQAANTFTVTNLTEGTHTLYFRATDNQYSCSQVVSIKITYDDVTPPSITCPNDATVSCAGQVPAWNIGQVTASDNCGTPVKSHMGDATGNQTCPNRYTVTRTYKADDNRGNTNTCEQIITVYDETPPTFTGVPANTTVQCNVVPPPANPTASDNCGGSTPVSYEQQRTDGDCLYRYTLTRIWSSTDVCGNNNSASQMITVLDTQAPTFSGVPANVTVQCNAVPPPANPTASDNCSTGVGISYNQARTDGNCPDSYTLTRTWTATDDCGNEKTATQIVTVRDTQAPNFTSVPANVTVQCNSLPAVGTSTATDNCDASVSIAYNGQTRQNGSCTDTYVLIRQWTATDNCGNTKTATQRINVIDNQKPNFTSTPSNVTVQCDAIPEPANPTATDNCDTAVAVTYNGQTQTNGACPNAYTLTRRWTAADNCGNTRTVTQRIVVVDNVKPAFTSFPENTTIACDENPPAVGSPTASDGCGTATVTYLGQSSTSGNCPGNYQIKRTWRATDACGNSTVSTQTIQVQDTGEPEFTSVPDPITIECGQPLPPLVNPTASDACGFAFVTFLGNVPSGSGCAQDYTVTRTWEAEDLCGNTATVTQVITVLGNNYGGEGAENREEGATRLIAHRSSLIVTPNPTTDRIRLDLTDFAGESVTVSIHGDLGQLVWEKHIPVVEDRSLSVSLLEAGAVSGIYTVTVRSKGGVAAKRVVLAE